MRSRICLYATQETDMYGSDVRVCGVDYCHSLCFDQSKKLSKMFTQHGYVNFKMKYTINDLNSWGYGT